MIYLIREACVADQSAMPVCGLKEAYGMRWDCNLKKFYSIFVQKWSEILIMG